MGPSDGFLAAHANRLLKGPHARPSPPHSSIDDAKEGDKVGRRRKESSGGKGLNVHLIRIRHMACGAKRVTGPAMSHLRGSGAATLKTP